jgi:hypothetical protein
MEEGFAKDEYISSSRVHSPEDSNLRDYFFQHSMLGMPRDCPGV